MKSILAAAALLTLAAPALAQQPPAAASPVLLGLGGRTCSVWTAERARDGFQGGLVWMEGFITAINITGLEPSRNLTSGYTIVQVGNQMDTYCARDPNLQIALAARQTIADLLTIRGRNPNVAVQPLPPLPPR